MGLFSSKKVVQVASVAYNLAGEERSRPDHRRSVVVRNILSGSKEPIGQSLADSYRNGPAIRLRRFFQWAQREGNYDQIGCPTGEIVSGVMISPSQVVGQVPHEPGEEVWIQKVTIDAADFGYWAEKWILDNRQEDIDTDWTADYDESTGKVLITFEDTTSVIFTPINFDYHGKYVFIYYMKASVDGEGDDQQTSYSDLALFIYKIGTGNAALDGLLTSTTNYNEFFPFIPVRLQNEFLSSTYLPDAFEQTKQAYRKATGATINQLISLIEDNDDLDKIDNAYVVFGIPLNVKEQAGRRYLYSFFDKLRQSQIGGPSAYSAFVADVENQSDLAGQWLEWKNANTGPSGGTDSGPSNPEPPRPSFKTLPDNEIRISSANTINTEYDVRLNWRFITRGSGSGLAKPGALSNECWVEYVGEDEVTKTVYLSQPGSWFSDTEAYQKFRIYWQRNADYYSYLEVIGAVHQNFVHGGKAVKILPKDALEEVADTGFILPLHNETWREISLADATQLASECVFIVFNCYEIHKQRWYETGIFRILLIIVIAIVSVVLTGGAGIGLLGAHLSVGTALGFSGMMAAIVGSVVNALAAVVLSTLIQQVVGDLGPLGQIIGAVLMFVAGNLAASFQSGSLALSWNSLLRVDNLIKLTNAIGGGVAGMLRAEAAALGQDMLDYAKWAEEETKKIQQAFFEEFGYGGGYIDPFMFVDNQGPIVESSDTFLTRTLMTGSDISEMTHELLYSFPELSLKLPDAFT